MVWYSYNNFIIIATNAIIVEFLFSQYAYPGARQLTILFFLTQIRTYK